MTPAHARLRPLVSRDDLAAAVRRLAAALRRDYQGRRPVLLGVLRGAFVFLADLVRELDLPLEVDFIQVRSYRNTRSSGRVHLLQEPGLDLTGRHVVLVEDIVDSGRTTVWLLRYLHRRGAASVRLCALLDKPAGRRVAVPVDYVGLVVPNVFVVGYGLDLDQQYRHLPEVYALEAPPAEASGAAP